MKKYLVLLAVIASAHGATFNVRDFGASGDGRTLDTSAIQKALDTCAESGGGAVEFPAGTYLTRPLRLHGSNVTVHLDAGALLQGSSNFEDYRGVAGLIIARDMANVTLDGPGTIDGAGQPWWPAVRRSKITGEPEPRRRPRMVIFSRCRGVIVRDVTLRNSPMFHLVPADCDDVLIDHVTIQAPGNSPNTDAIDPGPCRNLRIINCTIDVGDDNVAIKAGHAVPGRPFCCQDIVVSNCLCLKGHGISIGSETSGGLSNMLVTHCTFKGTTSGLRIKSNRQKGGVVEDVVCRDLVMTDVRYPINIAAYYPKVPSADTAEPMGPTTPVYRHIQIENLQVTAPQSAGLIVGLPESPITGVLLSNVQITAKTGLLLRNADVTLRNVQIHVQEGDSIIAQNARVHKL